MTSKKLMLTLILVSTSASLIYAKVMDHSLTLAEQAASENAAIARAAIIALRTQGASGLQTLLELYQHPTPTTNKQRLQSAIDEVAQQRYAYASRLYWYTDLEQAKLAAQATNKPILSLRLLGKLTEELSCANSRFFRIALYANAEVAQTLREKFILHWQSERPVPKVTIDFGDGRKMERTLTGNSIHYILDAEGKVVDALPGLYGPAAFLRELLPAAEAAEKVSRLPIQQCSEFLTRYHTTRAKALLADLTTDLKKIGATLPPATLTDSGFIAAINPSQPSPNAKAASTLAITKKVTETSLLNAALPALTSNTEVDILNRTWQQLAELHLDEVRLDESSRKLMRALNPKAYGNLGIKNGDSQAQPIDPLLATINNFERTMAEDTVRNQYTRHSQIYQWLLNGVAERDMEAFNKEVYATLFLTPATDSWLGLLPPEAYTAIENDGITK